MIFSVVILLLFSFVFANFAEELIEAKLYHFDQMIIDQVLLWVNPNLTLMMKFFTFLGSTKALIVLLLIVAGLMIWNKKRWEAIFLLIGTAGGAIFNEILKEIFHRERPTLHRLIEVKGYSFPSGHSMVSFIFYGMVCMFFIMFLESRAIKAVVFLITVFVIFMIGLSRIYLGVHYPSDVLAGFAAGGAWLIICLMGLRFILEIRKRKAKLVN
ncbi:phosphatase PAP2 family protein [Cytobacillus depressus]|uniref:Phosphatase PAP2 family protein n=2 Tax=Cytobacillus depressus TaxID=1602942 RepID=A0A6L3V2H0_9BACI|nr:phosphatase PAP2 family protein [Cytobacillus depressus]